MEANYATVWEAIADTIGDEDAVIQGPRRVSWRDLDARASRLAGAFAEAGVVRDGKVALYLYNAPEYIEAWFAAMKLRAVPVNVNYRYLDEELHYLLDNSDSEVVVFHSSLGDRVARVRDRLPLVTRWIEVADDEAHVDGTDRYEDVVSRSAPAPRIERSPDDIGITYTGGTTGMPKGVMSHVGGGVMTGLVTLPPLLGLPPQQPDDVPATARRLTEEGRRALSLVACPLMHGTGMGIGTTPAMTMGGAVVLLEGRRFDPREVWDAAERDAVTAITVVGDSFARPMVRALEDEESQGRSRDLSSVRLIASAGTMFSREVKEALVARMPQVLILDLMASTEGGMAQSVFTKDHTAETARFQLNPSAKVFTEDDREVAPGSGEVGMLAVAGATPLGYYKDPEKSARTFREIAGVRYSFPGDFATVESDGTITLLGRGSQVINTGGEKVFAEEVEEVVKRHPAVDDCLVVGVPDERFGQRVVAIAAPADGDAGAIDPTEVIAHTKAHLAAYKVPKQVIVVASVPRAPNGKADYATARDLASAPPA
ncbi:MAG TPA: AMP-binding protein [Acidimicrobiales bacterium]|nr:AMP-binding protein [Acidimicrobiales bacterium]